MKKKILFVAATALFMVAGLGFSNAEAAAPGYAQKGWYCARNKVVIGSGHAPRYANRHSPRIRADRYGRHRVIHPKAWKGYGWSHGRPGFHYGSKPAHPAVRHHVR